MEPWELQDPFKLAAVMWPHVYFYKQEREMIQSVVDNDATFVVAGNMLGKDFTAGFIALWFFLTRQPCRIVTTSATGDHLRVLWSEINRYIQTATQPLSTDKGGHLVVNHLNIRKVHEGSICPVSYMVGMVASPDRIAAMQGHHVANVGDGVPRTLFMSDESSSVPDDYYVMGDTWANRLFVFGNAWPCENFFKRGVEGGDLWSEDRKRCYRKVIRIRAIDSPNVRLGLAQKRRGLPITDEVLVPGVKSYGEYCKNREVWDEHEQCVKLDAEFYKGADIMMFPPAWLARAAEVGTPAKRVARAIGIDPAEGGDKTAMVAADEYGVVECVSKKTPNTDVITGEALAFMKRHGVEPENVVFDTGGGGRIHADRLRAQGHPVRTVAFGAACSAELRRGLRPLNDRKEQRERQYEYVNMRAEMYGELRQLLDPCGKGFSIRDPEIRRQLSPIPLLYDGEGRMRLLPKNPRGAKKDEECLAKLIGCSPDETDALVLAVHGMLHKGRVATAGAIV